MSKSHHPVDRVGIYKRLDEVPEHRRLRRYADAYNGRDVWEEFLTGFLFERYDSRRFVEDARRAGRRWRSHMDTRGRHHALATPADVEAWCEALLDDLTRKTAYNQYWAESNASMRGCTGTASIPTATSPS